MTRLRPVPDVAVVEEDGVVYAAPLPDGPIVVLAGGAAAIWVEACAGELETLPQRVAEITGTPIGNVRDDVESFVAELIGRGLLERAPR